MTTEVEERRRAARAKVAEVRRRARERSDPLPVAAFAAAAGVLLVVWRLLRRR